MPHFLPRMLALCGLLAVFGGSAVSADAPKLFRIDHLLLGAADLDQLTEQVATATGVRPVFGGKHPFGTHNALLSLGDLTYFELITAQPGAKPVVIGIDFSQLVAAKPIAWAVAVTDLAAARAVLEKAGFTATPSSPGSRVTPAGATLEWQSFGLVDGPAQAPFFIAWSATTPHPATTSPAGCKLVSLSFTGPDAAKLEALRAVMDVEVKVAESAAPAMTIELTCPAGRVVYDSRPSPQCDASGHR